MFCASAEEADARLFVVGPEAIIKWIAKLPLHVGNQIWLHHPCLQLKFRNVIVNILSYDG